MIVPAVRKSRLSELDSAREDLLFWLSRLLPADGLQIAVIDRAAFIRNKRATGRPKDLVDAALLEDEENPPGTR